MKTQVLSFGLLFLVSSCGSLRLSPKGCASNGIWGDKAFLFDLKFSEEYYVWNVDHEVRLKEFLKKRNIDCNEIKKMRVEIKSVFFVKRELSVFILK